MPQEFMLKLLKAWRNNTNKETIANDLQLPIEVIISYFDYWDAANRE